MNQAFTADLESRLQQLRADTVYKQLNYLNSPQAARVIMEGRGEVLILSSNNYLGLCSGPAGIEAGKEGRRRSLGGRERVGVTPGRVVHPRGTKEAPAPVLW